MTSFFSSSSGTVRSSRLSSDRPCGPSKAGKCPRRRSEEEWRDLLVDYERSSLTVKAFCALKGIALSNFYKRKRRAIREPLPTSPPTTSSSPAASALQEKDSKDSWPGFMPVSCPPPLAREGHQEAPSQKSPNKSAPPAARHLSCAPLTLSLGPDLILSIPPHFHEETLKKVVALLGFTKGGASC